MTLPRDPVPDRQARAARQAMVECQLMPMGVVAPRLVEAFGDVPRERFVPPERRLLAHVDAPQPLGGGRAMMAPLSLGLLLQALDPRGGERALVVGAGTGYSAAILARLGCVVTALEERADLAAAARAALGNTVAVVEGPLAEGWPAEPPYDLVLVDGRVDEIPERLAGQLREGGRLAAIVTGPDGVPRVSLGTRVSGRLHLDPIAEAGAPALPGFARAKGFVFA
jgi:protein-L-isoaspartate(D-aspartate) O-methyltransferase